VSSFQPSGVAIANNTDVTLQFTGLSGSEAGVQSLPASALVVRVDDTHANAQPLWLQQGRPEYPTRVQIQALKDASRMQADTVPTTPCGTGAVCVTLSMPAYGVALVAV